MVGHGIGQQVVGRVAEDTIDETAARVGMMGGGQGVGGVWIEVG
jgi:hypothetical protein